MIKARTTRFSSKQNESTRAFTLIELLLVLLVATIVLSVAIPRIRVVSKERGIRESARVVGSLISKASDEATINGTAGIVIRRNPNFSVEGRWYAATNLGILRAVPIYVGDQPFSKGATPSRGANRISDIHVDIPRPFEQDENPPVNIGDKISLNNSPVQFSIEDIEPEFSDEGRAVLRLELDVNPGSYPSIPPKFEDVPYAIHRQPILRQSSLQDLPQGHIIDLRFSGHDPVFESVVEDADPEFENYDIEIIFDRSGYVTSMFYRELDADNIRTGRSVKRTPEKPIYLLIAESPLSNDTSPLASPLSMWVTIQLQSTNALVGYNIPQPGELTSEAQLKRIVVQARGIAASGAHH